MMNFVRKSERKTREVIINQFVRYLEKIFVARALKDDRYFDGMA